MLGWRVALLIAGLAVLSGGAAYAQPYPSKPVRIITSDVGGGGDFVARIVAQGISGPLGQPVIVENRGGGVIPGQLVSKAQADGYTLLVFGNSLWLGPMLQSMPYDAGRDFAPISLMSASPNIVVVHPSVAATNIKELIALAKAKPGALNYGSAGTGSASHLAGELFKYMANVNIVRVPYTGVGPSLTGVAGGEVQIMFVVASAVAPFIKSGKLRPLAVTSTQPSALAPGLPTVTADLPGYEAVSVFGLWAPAKTPVAVVAKLNQETVRFLNLPATKERFFNSGSEVVATTPAQFSAAIKSEITRMGKVIKDAHIRVE